MNSSNWGFCTPQITKQDRSAASAYWVSKTKQTSRTWAALRPISAFFCRVSALVWDFPCSHMVFQATSEDSFIDFKKAATSSRLCFDRGGSSSPSFLLRAERGATNGCRESRRDELRWRVYDASKLPCRYLSLFLKPSTLPSSRRAVTHLFASTFPLPSAPTTLSISLESSLACPTIPTTQDATPAHARHINCPSAFPTTAFSDPSGGG